MRVVIRIAVNEDLAKLGELQHQLDVLHHEVCPDAFPIPDSSWRTGIDYRLYLRWSDRGALFLAFVDGLPVAMVLAERCCWPEGAFESNSFIKIKEFVVLEQYRSKGIGKKLMKRLLDWGRKRGITIFRLDVAKFNKMAQAFYYGFGFEVVSESMLLNTEAQREELVSGSGKSSGEYLHLPHIVVLPGRLCPGLKEERIAMLIYSGRGFDLGVCIVEANCRSIMPMIDWKRQGNPVFEVLRVKSNNFILGAIEHEWGMAPGSLWRTIMECIPSELAQPVH